MCRIDGAERCMVIQSKDRKAAKMHLCSECGREIALGETYHYETTIFEGSRDSSKTCAHCMVGREWLIKNCGGFIYGEVIEEIQEHGDEYPKLRLPLYRVVAGARRKWQRFGNGLMTVPKMPPPISVHEH